MLDPVTEIKGENILEDASHPGVLYVGPPSGTSTYASIVRERHRYNVQGWASIATDYSGLVDNPDQLSRHVNGVPLVVDVTHVGMHFIRYLRQSGIDNCVPIITFDDKDREPLTFRNPESGLWHVSERDAVSTLHLLHGEHRINFGVSGFNREREEDFNNRIEHFGTPDADEEERSLWPLAVACLIAEREQTVVPS